MSNTINSSYGAQVLGVQKKDIAISTMQNEEKSSVSSIPQQDQITISNQAKALANPTTKSTMQKQTLSDSSSSEGNALEEQIKNLEEKISELEKEIAKEKKSADDERSRQSLRVKEAMLASYHAQLAALQAEIIK